MHYDIKDLRLFVSIAHHQNIKRAAAENFMTLAAASIRIKKLESAFKTQLLHRNPRGVTLTEAGEKLYEDAKVIISQTNTLEAHQRSYSRKESTTVRVYANYASFVGKLQYIIGDFLVTHPEIKVDFFLHRSDEIAAAVAEGVADIGLLADKSARAGVRYIPYFKDHYVFLLEADNPAVKRLKNPLQLKDVQDFPIVALNSENLSQEYFEQHAASLALHFNIRARFPSLYGCVETMRKIHGGMFALGRSRIANLERFVAFDISDPWRHLDIQICVPEQAEKMSQATRLLFDFLAKDAATESSEAKAAASITSQRNANIV